MKAFHLGTLTGLIFFSTTAVAQLDTGSNGLGIYFDEAATIVSTSSSVPQTWVHGYLILTNPTDTGGIAYWMALIYSGDTPPDVIIGYPRVGTNEAVHMPGSDSWFFAVVIDSQTPLLLSSITVLADVYVQPNYDRSQIRLYIIELMKYSTVGPTGPFVICTPSSGDEGLPVAIIDGAIPVPSQKATWGNVKALFK